jgi:uroporphyrinogen-III decarboxylase
MLRGTSAFYLDMLLDPDFAHGLVELVQEPCARFGRALADAGADIICISNPVANQDCVSREHYELFAHHSTKALFDDLKSHAPGLKTMFHTCGSWADRFDLVAAESVDVLHVDKADIRALKRAYGHLTVMGKVAAVDTLLRSDPAAVEAEAAADIAEGAGGGRFILSANCTVPPATPLENLLALRRAVEAAA